MLLRRRAADLVETLTAATVPKPSQGEVLGY